jgi:hypothetical protein
LTAREIGTATLNQRPVNNRWTGPAQRRAPFFSAVLGRHLRSYALRSTQALRPANVKAWRCLRATLVARHADWWNVSSTGIAAYRAYLSEFERACDEVGRDAATVRRTWGGGCRCVPTEADVADFAAEQRRWGADATYQVGEDFVGTPAQVIAQMRPFVELGVDYFMLDCGGFPQLTTVELLIQEVLPALNR